MAKLKFLWLGTPEVFVDNHPLQLETRKSLALLAYVSISPHAVTRELISTIFWPDFDQEHALANLRRSLYSLGTFLPPGVLQANRDNISFNSDDGIHVDVREYHNFLMVAQNHVHTVDQACDECHQNFENALITYRGDFLTGFNLKDCPEFDDWQFLQRENLRSEQARVLEKLSEYDQQKGDWEKAITHTKSWLAMDKINESVHRRLMQLFFLSGQKSAALHQFFECERIIKQELDQAPEVETVELFEKIQKESPPGTQNYQTTFQLTNSLGNLDFPLTKTKFLSPNIPRLIIHRPRLVSLMNQCIRKPITLLSASAGFGKTTLLAEWSLQCPDFIAWLSLDRGDNDQYRFLDYIISAIRNVLPDKTLGVNALNLLHSPQPADISVIIGTLINDISSLNGHIILVLDDYHNINSSSIHDVVNLLLDRRPQNLHLLISSRSDPPLSLARVRANLQLGDIRTDDLRFTVGETQAFLTQLIGFPLSSQDLDSFGEKVEGWIAGIQMAALAIQSNNLAPSSFELRNFIRDFKGSQRYILDYLMEEVLNHQTEEIRSFLFHTSILENLCAPLCDSLLVAENSTEIRETSYQPGGIKKTSQEILEFLEKSNLFLIPQDDEGKWYRYHHLFSDLLHVRLQQYEPKLESILHRKAANWYAQNSFSMEAVKHALESGDFSFAADLIEEFSLNLMWMNQIVTTIEWFKLLPPEVIDSRPLLSVYKGFLLARKGEYEKVEAIMKKAEAYISTVQSTPKTDEYLCLIYGMRAFLSNLQGEPEKAIQHYEACPQLRNTQLTKSCFLARTQLAVAYLDTGNLDAAEKVLGEMLHWAQQNGDVYYAALTSKELADICVIRGQLGEADWIHLQMREWIQTSLREPADYIGLVRVYKAILFIEKNELKSADFLLHEDIEKLLEIWRSSSLYIGFTVKAYLHTALGNFQQAAIDVARAVELVTSQSLYPRNRTTVNSCQVNLWLREGNLVAARKWVQSNFPQTPTFFSFIMELDHINLARVLVACHQWKEANDLLTPLAVNAKKGKRFGRLLKINILQSLVLNGLGQTEIALKKLEECLLFAHSEGYFRAFLDEGSAMMKLIQQGIASGRWKDLKLLNYAEKMIKEFSN